VSTDLVAEKVGLDYRRGTAVTAALADIDLTIEQSQFVTLVGPSGCGKSSFLNLVAGFLQPSHGRLLLDGAPVVAPGADRGVVFQEHALFPWMTVEKNIAAGPRANGVPAAEVRRIVDESLDMIGLQRFAKSYPKELSGGMRQRVAIARALANKPKMLLMDEPFAALDAQTRRFLQGELVRIWQHLRTTILFITHSIDEAILLSDRVYIMTARPGTIKDVIDIDLPRPRDENQPAFLTYRRRITEQLQYEIDKSLDEFEHAGPAGGAGRPPAGKAKG
jgi:NitT/TauT family transport system ATP-binding protein